MSPDWFGVLPAMRCVRQQSVKYKSNLPGTNYKTVEHSNYSRCKLINQFNICFLVSLTTQYAIMKILGSPILCCADKVLLI